MNTMYGTVEHTAWLTPSMVRVVLGGDGLAGFTPTEFTDQYVNALFVPDDAPFDIPFDPETVAARWPEHRPRGRRETVRAWDGATGQLTIDFVAHGDVGHAGRWAQRAVPGDRLQMVGPAGGYRPDPHADWHLLVGDESALPAIGASLEAVPAGARCVVVAVVDDHEHELELMSDGELTVQWLHRRKAEDPTSLLAGAVAALPWSSGSVDVFVHGEAAEVRAVRRLLIAERGISREHASISPYWRRGHDDEAWRAVKREWVAAQERDV